MSMNDDRRDGPDEDKLLVGEFALGLLHADEHARVAGRIAADPALKAELRLWQSRLAGLDSEFAEAPAPAGAFARVEARLHGASSQPARGGLWESLMLWRAVAAGSLAVAAIAIGVNLMQPRIDPQQFATELVAAIEAQEGSGVSFVALYDPKSGSVRLTALSGSDMPENDYELWAIQGDAAPVSMGVITVSSRANIAMPETMPEGFGEGTVLAVSVEPKGGSPTGAPTGRVVAVGKATAI